MTAPTIVQRGARVDFGDRTARRRRRLRVLICVLTAMVAGAAIWIVYFSSILAVKDVRVVGADGPLAGQVLRAAAVPLGDPLIRVDTAAAQAGVLALPWVATAEIRRGWPNEVVLAVTARTPIAVLVGSTTAVDASGVSFAADGTLPTTLPVVSADGVGLEAAMAVLAALPADILAKVVTISASTRDDVEMAFRSGAVVRWGSAEQPEFKAEVLRALLRHKREVYDVTAPELATTFRGS